jgi:hypothetical protein
VAKSRLSTRPDAYGTRRAGAPDITFTSTGVLVLFEMYHAIHRLGPVTRVTQRPQAGLEDDVTAGPLRGSEAQAQLNGSYWRTAVIGTVD